MNWNQIKGNRQQLSAKLKKKWGKLTYDELTAIAGNRDQLIGVLQQRYDYEKERAELELNMLIHRLTS